eukprot:780284-Karenia_brevis.AAC.1
MGMEDADDDMWELEDDEVDKTTSAMGVLKDKSGAQSASSSDAPSLAITDGVAGEPPTTAAKALMHI